MDHKLGMQYSVGRFGRPQNGRRGWVAEPMRPIVINTIVNNPAPAGSATGLGPYDGEAGVGIVFDENWSAGIPRIVVRTAVPGGPADRSQRVRPGDVLVLVDGRSVHAQSLDYAASLIRGPPGTPIRLGFTDQEGIFLDLKLRREIGVPSLPSMPRSENFVTAGSMHEADEMAPSDGYEEIWIPRSPQAGVRSERRIVHPLPTSARTAEGSFRAGVPNMQRPPAVSRVVIVPAHAPQPARPQPVTVYVKEPPAQTAMPAGATLTTQDSSLGLPRASAADSPGGGEGLVERRSIARCPGLPGLEVPDFGPGGLGGEHPASREALASKMPGTANVPTDQNGGGASAQQQASTALGRGGMDDGAICPPALAPTAHTAPARRSLPAARSPSTRAALPVPSPPPTPSPCSEMFPLHRSVASIPPSEEAQGLALALSGAASERGSRLSDCGGGAPEPSASGWSSPLQVPVSAEESRESARGAPPPSEAGSGTASGETRRGEAGSAGGVSDAWGLRFGEEGQPSAEEPSPVAVPSRGRPPVTEEGGQPREEALPERLQAYI